jgi:hypothetical protein
MRPPVAEMDVRVARLAGEQIVQLLGVVAQLVSVDGDGERDVRVRGRDEKACTASLASAAVMPPTSTV